MASCLIQGGQPRISKVMVRYADTDDMEYGDALIAG